MAEFPAWLNQPRLRPVEAFPVELSEGQRAFCLRDPVNYAPQPIFLPLASAYVLQLFDGVRTVEEIQAEFCRLTSQILPRETLEKFILDLDARLYLDSDTFQAARNRIDQDFRAASVRPMAHAGGAYEADGEALARRLEGYRTAAGPVQESVPHRRTLRGLISPHIDYQRGGVCYAYAWRELRVEDYDLFVILGTSHWPTEQAYAVTIKDFDTPLGALPVDREYMEQIRRRYSKNVLQDELRHRTEHSIELQTVFLKHVANGTPVKIAPILVGSFHEAVERQGSPSDSAEVAEFIELLQTLEKEMGRRICYVAGADLAHIGVKFGDAEPPTDALMQWVEREDRESLAAAARGDAEGWFASVAKDGDRRRICGLSPVYTMLKVLGPQAQGELLRYQQCNDPTGFQNVTIASMASYA
ncbi:MAG: AmmeMemoRadiSam system protein B [Candidatus Xenobia bacterium]